MTDTDLVLVCRATGDTGSGVASSLLAKGRRVRALVVDCAVSALTGDTQAIDGETFVLTVPASIGFADVAATLSEVVGRTVRHTVPHEAAIASMPAMGVPQWIAEGYGELDDGFEHAFADLTTRNVHAFSGHQPRDFERFARDFAHFFTPTLVSTS